MDYYKVVVEAARMIGKVDASKKELEKVLVNIFSYLGKELDKSSFSEAYTRFRNASGGKMFKAIYA